MSMTVAVPTIGATTAPRERRERGSRHWFADRSVRTKILSAVGVVAIVAAVVSIVASNGLSRAGGDIRGLAQTQDELVKPLSSLRAAQNSQRAIILRAGLASGAGIDSLLTQVQSNAKQIAGDMTALDDEMTELAPQSWAAMQQAWNDYSQLIDGTLVPLVKSDQDAKFAAAYEKQAMPLVDALSTAMDKVTADASAHFDTVAGSSESSNSAAIWQMWVVFAVGLALAVLLSLYVASAVRGPLTRVQRALEAMARQDLTVTADVTSRDEVGRMATALRAAREHTRSVIAGVISAVDAVASSSEELSASATQIASGAEETSAQAGVVAAASEQVSRNVQSVAAAAEQMSASIGDISRNANHAATIASQAAQAAESTTETVAKLGESSEKIGGVVKTITAIAAQTNLLALNATIEAARAGDAGKGFAVVAGEVKDLAQQVAAATQDIAARIEAIQADSGEASRAITGISEIIAEINDLEASIAGAVEEQTATTQEMSRNISEASVGTGEIAANITGVATAADSTTQAVTQTRTAIDDLAHMATDLRQEVDAFVV